MKLFLNKWLKVKNGLKRYGVKSLSLLAILSALTPKIAFSASGGMQDSLAVQKLGDLQTTISGPILTSISVIMIVVTTLMLAFGEWGDGFKRLVQIVFWISIAAGASSMVTSFVG